MQPCHVPELAPRVAGPRAEDSESREGSALGKLSPRLRITLLGRWMWFNNFPFYYLQTKKERSK